MLLTSGQSRLRSEVTLPADVRPPPARPPPSKNASGGSAFGCSNPWAAGRPWDLESGTRRTRRVPRSTDGKGQPQQPVFATGWGRALDAQRLLARQRHQAAQLAATAVRDRVLAEVVKATHRTTAQKARRRCGGVDSPSVLAYIRCDTSVFEWRRLCGRHEVALGVGSQGEGDSLRMFLGLAEIWLRDRQGLYRSANPDMDPERVRAWCNEAGAA